MLGARAVHAPAIKTVPPSSWKKCDAALKRFETFDTVVFTSATAVGAFFHRAGKRKPPKFVYAVGPATAKALVKIGWKTVSIPDEFRSDSLVRIRGKKVLIPRAEVAREVLPKALRKRGASVTIAPVYRTVGDPKGLAKLKKADDWIAFTSGSTVTHTLKAIGSKRMASIRAASIGPITSDALRAIGIEPAAEATRSTADGLADAIATYSKTESTSALKTTLKKALHAAGAIQRKYLNKVQAKRKGGWRANLITKADLAAEEKILGIILAKFPNHDFLAEERPPRAGGSEYTWVIDPIDGTTNYAHGFPMSCVSIGLVHRGRALMGGIYEPSRDELFFAERGKGATLNGKRIRVSKAPKLADSLLITGFAYDRDVRADYYLGIVKEFLKCTHGIRRSGSAALDLAWTAAGRLDGYWEFHLNPWDVAAGRLIVEEAGGTVTDFSGKEWGDLKGWGKQTLATNGRIHKEMLRHLKKLV